MKKNKSLKELYCEIIDNKQDLWNYYYSENYNCNILSFNFDDLNSQDKCKSFIEQYLRHGGKGEVPFFVDNFHELCPKRIKHIVSCFFWGLVLYSQCEGIKSSIQKMFRKRQSPIEGENAELHFAYIWFLTCLFHDLGYAIEDNYLKAEANKEKFDTFFFKEFQKRPAGIPSVFTKALLHNYLKWRICCKECYDHGIIGGISLYHDLCKFRKDIVVSSNLALYDYVRDGLYWGDNLEKDFLYAAWVIACHNVWITKDGEANAYKYHCFDLDALIRDTPIINLQNHPFPFLFCLADSLEFIKNVGSTFLFEKVKIKFEETQIIVDLSEMTNIERHESSKQIRGLNWLTLVEEKQKGVFTINLQFK